MYYKVPVASGDLPSPPNQPGQSDMALGVLILDPATGKPVPPGGGQGGGGAATIADGADVALGARADDAATSDTGAFSLIALVKRALQNWTSLLTRIPTIGPKAGAASISMVPATDARLTVGSKYVTAITAVPDGTDVRFMVGEFGQLMVQTMGVINGIPYNPQLLQSGANVSGTITGVAAQVLAPANTARRQLTGQNISSGDLWFSETGTAVIGAAGSFRVPSGQSFAVSTNRAISVIGATVGQAWTATEF